MDNQLLFKTKSKMKKWKYITLMTLLYLLIGLMVKVISMLSYQDVETGWGNALLKDLPVLFFSGLVLSFVLWPFWRDRRKNQMGK